MIELIVTKHDDGSVTTKEIVRCKNCKKHETYDCPVKDSYDGECIPYRTDDNFYCADGVPKGGEKE